MERATASANNIDLEVINEAITIVAGAQFCISREESVLIFDGLSIRFFSLAIPATVHRLPRTHQSFSGFLVSCFYDGAHDGVSQQH